MCVATWVGGGDPKDCTCSDCFFTPYTRAKKRLIDAVRNVTYSATKLGKLVFFYVVRPCFQHSIAQHKACAGGGLEVLH